LVALCNLLSTRFLIDDVAGWLEMPLVSGVPVTGLDLLAENRIDLLLRWAGHVEANPDDILDEFDPTWRESAEANTKFLSELMALQGSVSVRSSPLEAHDGRARSVSLGWGTLSSARNLGVRGATAHDRRRESAPTDVVYEG
jgi:hypothetical protein